MPDGVWTRSVTVPGPVSVQWLTCSFSGLRGGGLGMLFLLLLLLLLLLPVDRLESLSLLLRSFGRAHLGVGGRWGGTGVPRSRSGYLSCARYRVK